MILVGEVRLLSLGQDRLFEIVPVHVSGVQDWLNGEHGLVFMHIPTEISIKLLSLQRSV